MYGHIIFVCIVRRNLRLSYHWIDCKLLVMQVVAEKAIKKSWKDASMTLKYGSY